MKNQQGVGLQICRRGIIEERGTIIREDPLPGPLRCHRLINLTQARTSTNLRNNLFPALNYLQKIIKAG